MKKQYSPEIFPTVLFYTISAPSILKESLRKVSEQAPEKMPALISEEDGQKMVTIYFDEWFNLALKCGLANIVVCPSCGTKNIWSNGGSSLKMKKRYKCKNEACHTNCFTVNDTPLNSSLK
jgi:hypothetical protein